MLVVHCARSGNHFHLVRPSAFHGMRRRTFVAFVNLFTSGRCPVLQNVTKKIERNAQLSYLWIRKEKVAECKISDYVWKGSKSIHELMFDNVVVYVFNTFCLVTFSLPLSLPSWFSKALYQRKENSSASVLLFPSKRPVKTGSNRTLQRTLFWQQQTNECRLKSVSYHNSIVTHVQLRYSWHQIWLVFWDHFSYDFHNFLVLLFSRSVDWNLFRHLWELFRRSFFWI